MSANPDSVGNQGEFHSSVPPAKPVTTSGHQLGQPAGTANVPEFRAKTYPPGSAPQEHSHQPNPVHSIPGQALNADADPSGRTEALDMPGATSRDVYNESTFSRPMQGLLGKEAKENKAHAGKRVKEHSGLEGVGATAKTPETVEGRARALGADLPEGVERGVRGGKPGAEEMEPASAVEVAAEEGRRG